MTYIPNENKPAEVGTMWELFQKLRRFEKDGRWDLEQVGKWLKNDLLQAEQALERLDEHLEQLYPGSEYQHEIVMQEGQKELVWSLKQAIEKESEVA